LHSLSFIHQPGIIDCNSNKLAMLCRYYRKNIGLRTLSIVLIFFSVTSFSQNTVRIPLELKSDMIENNRFYRHIWPQKKDAKPQTPIRLSNGDISVNYGMKSIIINATRQPKDTINIIPGITTNAQSFIRTVYTSGKKTKIYDNYINKNLVAGSDTVFFKNIEGIKVDSVATYDYNDSLTYAPYFFWSAITKGNGNYIKNNEELTKLNNGFTLTILSNFYLSGFYLTDADSMRINIILYSLLNNLYKYKVDSLLYAPSVIRCYQKHINSRDSIIYDKNIFELDSGYSDSVFFLFKDKWIKIKEVNFSKSYIDLLVYDSASYKPSQLLWQSDSTVDNVELLDANKNKLQTVDFNSAKTYYVLLTGSWCQPCKAVQAEIIKNKKQYKNIKNFMVVAAERNSKQAAAYLVSYPVQFWKYYYPLNNFNASIVSKKFKTHSFPSLITIKNGKILSVISSGQDVIDELKRIVIRNTN
jgi:thiol-disulfide isomerase/thioredoxin